MIDLPTFLAPGQRYARPGHRPWPGDDHLTILRVERDALGFVWVTYRAPDGEDCSGPATRIEAALAAGRIVPVSSDHRIAWC